MFNNSNTYVYSILYILKKTWDKYSTILTIQINVQAMFKIKKDKYIFIELLNH